MKISNLFTSLLLASLAISFGCDDDDSGPETFDFEAVFFTDLISLGQDSTTCAPPMNLLNVQEGSGSEPTIGDFTTDITFCVDPLTFEYGNTDAVMTDENGDKLYLDISGQVVTTTEPGYDFEFKDPFNIIGGTGRFEGATGSGTTNSLNNSTTGRTDHTWSGTITLIK